MITPIVELSDKTQQLINQVVLTKQDLVVEQQGEQYAVILSSARYKTLMTIARTWARERFINALEDVHQSTADIPLDEIDDLIADVLRESRRARAKVYAPALPLELLYRGRCSGGNICYDQ